MAKIYPMTIILVSDAPDRIHMAMTVAATAAAGGRPTSLFFAKRSAVALTEGGWEALCARTGTPADALANHQANCGVADFSVLLEALTPLNVRFLVCEQACREFDISPDALLLRPHVETTDIATLLEEGFGGDWLTF